MARFFLFDTGSIKEPRDLIHSLKDEKEFKPSERNKAQYIDGCYKLLTGSIHIPPKNNKFAAELDAKGVLYVAASSLPNHINGYTLRTQGITKAIHEIGWRIICVTRPGYPYDRPDALGDASQDKNEELPKFSVLDGPHRRKIALDNYLTESAEIIAKKAISENVSLIHAASNYEVAIPSLIAARKLGIPFTYEVRGLWEYSAASKISGWESTERFDLDRKLETLASKNADRVFTLTNALADELEQRGVDRQKIELAPNAIASSSFLPLPYDRSLAERLGLDKHNFTIGYIGSIVSYEGLDDLVSAFALIADRYKDARLLIVGDGDALPSLRRQIEDSGLSQRVILPGRVTPSEVPNYFSLLNVISLPRKPLTVCKLVSPLKPFEAMAMRVPLIVSDVPALAEIVRDGTTALIHEAGNTGELADCMIRFMDKKFAGKVAEAARKQVFKTNTWDKIASTISDAYTALTQPD